MTNMRYVCDIYVRGKTTENMSKNARLRIHGNMSVRFYVCANAQLPKNVSAALSIEVPPSSDKHSINC